MTIINLAITWLLQTKLCPNIAIKTLTKLGKTIRLAPMGFIKYILIIALSLASGAGWGDETAPQPAPSRAELAIFAISLVGSVYKFGGDDPSTGMDCSGFVKYVYSQVAGVELPHNARAISKISTIIKKADLKPGDLVFFKTMRKAFSHVGIYLGQNRFIHAANKRTGVVIISHLDNAYWSAKFDGARRLLKVSAPTPITDPTAGNADAANMTPVTPTASAPGIITPTAISTIAVTE